MENINEEYPTPQNPFILLIVLILCLMCFGLLSGCKTLCIPETIEVEREVIVTERDTTIITQPDAATAIALLECDSNYNVVLSDLQLSNGERIRLQAALNKRPSGEATFIVDCKEDSLINRISWLEEQINTTTTQTIVKVEKYIPGYYKFCSWAFWILLGVVLLGTAIRILLKVYLHI